MQRLSPFAAPSPFTGQERDTETGLDYFGARYYGSALGRFTSPDPFNAGADPTHPQSWNAYSYVGNNPLVFTDPTGTTWLGDFWHSISGFLGADGSGASLCVTLTDGANCDGYGGGSGRDTGGNTSSGGGGSSGDYVFYATAFGVQNVSTVSMPINYVGAPGGGASRPVSTPIKNVARPDWLNNITSIFGYDQRIPLPSCFGDFVNNTISNLLPFLPGLSNVSEEGFGVASRVAYNRALSYAASTPSQTFGTSFLRYPFKSSVFRGILSKSAALADAAPMAGVVTAEGQALYNEVQSMKQGACQ